MEGLTLHGQIIFFCSDFDYPNIVRFLSETASRKILDLIPFLTSKPLKQHFSDGLAANSIYCPFMARRFADFSIFAL